jgi:hypothetical protein
MAGPVEFVLVEYDKSLRSEGGMGLLWYAEKKYKDFVLKVDWKASSKNDNSEYLSDFEIQTMIL